VDKVTVPRVIPMIQLHQDDAVKTVQFRSPKYIGDPINTIRIFSDRCADEVLVIDIGAARGKYGIQLSLLDRLVSEAFMPFCYGGGIRSIQQANELFGLGIEKVLVRWRGEQTTDLIREISTRWGAQAVTVCIDYVRRIRTRRQRNFFAVDEILFQMKMVEMSGAGEVAIQSVDKDGTMSGFDLEVIRRVSKDCGIQLMALGGSGRRTDIAQAIAAGASAVACGSLFVYRNSDRAVLINYPDVEEIENLIQVQNSFS
jgi:cyclase